MLRIKEKQASGDKDAPPINDDIMKLTTSETRRNIGSVTCFLDPKIFEENHRTGCFATDEIWLPIKDITVTPSASSNVSVSKQIYSRTMYMVLFVWSLNRVHTYITQHTYLIYFEMSQFEFYCSNGTCN